MSPLLSSSEVNFNVPPSLSHASQLAQVSLSLQVTFYIIIATTEYQ